MNASEKAQTKLKDGGKRVRQMTQNVSKYIGYLRVNEATDNCPNRIE
jgi:hypothetical protein